MGCTYYKCFCGYEIDTRELSHDQCIFVMAEHARKHTQKTDEVKIYNDAYWLRYFAAAAMQGSISFSGICPGSLIEIPSVIEIAQSYLTEIKRVEAEKNEK